MFIYRCYFLKYFSRWAKTILEHKTSPLELAQTNYKLLQVVDFNVSFRKRFGKCLPGGKGCSWFNLAVFLRFLRAYKKCRVSPNRGAEISPTLKTSLERSLQGCFCQERLVGIKEAGGDRQNRKRCETEIGASECVCLKRRRASNLSVCCSCCRGRRRTVCLLSRRGQGGLEEEEDLFLCSCLSQTSERVKHKAIREHEGASCLLSKFTDGSSQKHMTGWSSSPQPLSSRGLFLTSSFRFTQLEHPITSDLVTFLSRVLYTLKNNNNFQCHLAAASLYSFTLASAHRYRSNAGSPWVDESRVTSRLRRFEGSVQAALRGSTWI